ncbi:S41 family peptidase [Croceimicrobium hydrocarbonivorans]|uniref:S41 family peptidase n=1 Tax=Croceimicrobium hydrocarbonivorans TaxID=2761580 RepID=A0A7H0VG58_9FLAO|nr:S41 family peptidase [Croceimicrobium hydrocarbonivorans]QNR24706.1 S41 family peptidase [Croceimicrobium hydrocarbonivorans]
MRKPLILYFSLLLLSLGANTIMAQALSKDELLTDLLQLKSSIEEYQVTLFEFQSPDVWNQNCTELFSQIKEDSAQSYSHQKAFYWISRLTSLANEGHYRLGNWQDTVHSGFLANRYLYLPIAVWIIDGRLYLRKDYSKEQCLIRGSEILSINGLSSSEIVDKLRKCNPADANILSYKDRVIESGFNWQYYLYVDTSSLAKIQYLDNDSIQSCQIKALCRDSLFAQVNRLNPPAESSAEDRFYSLKFESNTAWLELPTFDRNRMEQFNIDPDDFYEAIFDSIRTAQSEHLVIDLRANTGGRNEMVDEILPYLIHGELNVDFLRKSISWKGKEKKYRFPKRDKNAFQGQIYVLIDGLSFSNGSVLARHLKEYSNAMIIGEESGSRYTGFAAGSQEQITLQNSGLQIGIPRYYLFYGLNLNQENSNQGVIPHIPVRYRLEDRLMEKDLAREVVLEQIKKRQ